MFIPARPAVHDCAPCPDNCNSGKLRFNFFLIGFFHIILLFLLFFKNLFSQSKARITRYSNAIGYWFAEKLF